MRQFISTVMVLLLAMPPTGYTATITGEQTIDTVYIHINAYHSTDEHYNTCEIVLTYDAEILRFVPERSTLGWGYRDTNGRLKFIDFGPDKALGESVYVVAFEVIGTGKATIDLSYAAFSTAAKAATQNIEPIINKPNSITLYRFNPNYIIEKSDIIWNGLFLGLM